MAGVQALLFRSHTQLTFSLLTLQTCLEQQSSADLVTTLSLPHNTPEPTLQHSSA